jgi:Ca2+-binding EF-hand superfamily protein
MRRSLVLLLPVAALLVAGLAVGQDRKDKPRPDKSRPADKAEAGKDRPLFDLDAFIKEHDTNKDGYLSKDELPEVFRHNFDKLDTNKDGKISREEARGHIKKDFDAVDTNKDGFIDREELLRAASEKPRGLLPPKGATPAPSKKAADRPKEG